MGNSGESKRQGQTWCWDYIDKKLSSPLQVDFEIGKQ
jgi:hypothetical protein